MFGLKSLPPYLARPKVNEYHLFLLRFEKLKNRLIIIFDHNNSLVRNIFLRSRFAVRPWLVRPKPPFHLFHQRHNILLDLGEWICYCPCL